MKKFIKNILYFVEINSILFICHIWALFGVIFNDTGVQYNSIGEAMNTIIFGIIPLIIGTIILINVFKKNKEFSICQFLILQSIIIIGWTLIYIMSYVPSFYLNQYIEEKIYDINIDKQEEINEEAKKELIKEYKVIDSIKNDTTKITLYLNEGINKLIVELESEGQINYSIIDVTNKISEAKKKFAKYNEDYIIEFDKYSNLSIILNSNRYYMYSNYVIENNSDNYDIYINVKGNKVDPINEYRKLIENSIAKEEQFYYINDNKFLEIEKTDMGVKIKQNSLKDKKIDANYIWVIIKDGEVILQRVLTGNELIFEKDLTKKEFYGEIGNYEIYIKTYENDIGYFRISNSVYWSNK